MEEICRIDLTEDCKKPDWVEIDGTVYITTHGTISTELDKMFLFEIEASECNVIRDK